MSSESEALLRNIQGWKRTRVGPFRGAGFKIAGRECILVTSGMGIKRAAAATRFLIETFHPACLVSFGIAGAVREDLKIGDVVMAIQSYTLEKGCLSSFQPLATLSSEARNAAEQVIRLRRTRFITGTAVTTRGSQLFLQQPQEMVNPVLEMETAGILEATGESGTPLVVLRSVSDGPLAPLPFDLETIMDDDYNLLPGRLLLAVLKHPRSLLQSGKMMKNSRIAADNAAIAVVAVLGQSSPLMTGPTDISAYK
jgi:nucleoside phosphorylase